jgi:predicted ATP-dependent endonuclease of OLD family
MQIHFIEIQNFRKLKSVHVDLAKMTTLFVGANNSGNPSRPIMAILRIDAI